MNVPPHERMVELNGRMKAGDAEARDEMILGNLPLVHWVATSCYGRVREQHFPDLKQAGVLGLIRAVDDWRPGNGHFSTYARYWILNEMQAEWRRIRATVHVPGYCEQLLRVFLRTEKRLAANLRRLPEPDEVLDAMPGLSPFRRAAVLHALASLRAEVHDIDGYVGDDELRECDERLKRYDPAGVEEAEEAEELGRRAARLLGGLESRERRVITKRFGLDGEMALTLTEVGRRIGRTRERVRQIEKKAIRRMQQAAGVAS